MANRWRIPSWLEQEVSERDRQCVYCRIAFGAPDPPRRERPSWEHIVNDLNIISRDNIALCCIGCNSSKGARDIEAWLQGSYCLGRNINIHTVAPVVQAAIRRRPVLATVDGGPIIQADVARRNRGGAFPWLSPKR